MILKPSEKLVQAIALYQAGDKTAFDTIYYESIKYVTKSVLNVLNRTAPEATEDLQQDIIQDTYLTIATKLDTLQNPESFLQWAGQIATRNAQRTFSQDVKRQLMEQPEDDMVYEIPDEDFIPEDILQNKEKQRLIRQMLEELPTNQYLCVVEYFYNGLKEAEVAEKLGMPVNTVKTNLSRAKKKLRSVIETEEKKSGVKLYSMGWLLLLLFWDDVLVMVSKPVAEAATLTSIHAKMAVNSATATTAGTVTGTATGTAAATSGAATTGGAATAMGASLAAKIGAFVVAGVVAVAGIAGGVALSNKEKDEQVVSTAPSASVIAPPVTSHAPTTAPTTAPTAPVEPDIEIPSDAFVYNGHSYYLFTDYIADTWEGVQWYCESLGGYLACITSAEENEALYGYLRQQGYWDAYFGLYFDETNSTWNWVSGEPVDYLNWHEGEPSNATPPEKYGMFYRKFRTGTWNNGGCAPSVENYDYVFICEWDAAEQPETEIVECTDVYTTTFADTVVLSASPITEYNGRNPDAPSVLLRNSEDHSGYKATIEYVVILDELVPQSTQGWFKNMWNLNKITGLEKLNMQNVTDMSSMFEGCSALTQIDGLGTWDTGNVMNMSRMFAGCSSLEKVQDIFRNTENVTDMGHMFSRCGSLTYIGGLDIWNVHRVTNMECMFIQCSSLGNIGDLSNWTVANDVDMSYMFAGCRTLADIGDTSGWNLSGEADVTNMFLGCGIADDYGDYSMTEEEAVVFAEDYWGLEHGKYYGENKVEDAGIYVFEEGVNSEGVPYFKFCLWFSGGIGGRDFIPISKIDGSIAAP